MKILNKDVKIAASPINWHNDDFPILGSNVSVESILSGISEAGYSGTSLSSLFPSTSKDLKPLLENFHLELASGWHSAYFLSRIFDDEIRRFTEFVKFLRDMGSSIVTVAECTYCPFKPFPEGRFKQHFDALKIPLFPYQLPTLTNEQWKKIADGMKAFKEIADDNGLKMGYHPHMQTVVQNESHLEILADIAPDLCFTIDTGHLSLAGDDPVKIIKRYIDRVVYLHVKNTRKQILNVVHSGGLSFEWSVIEGVFTVPGAGMVDFVKIFDLLKSYGYKGWILVEAEQNPLVANPVLYAKLAREYIRELTGW